MLKRLDELANWQVLIIIAVVAFAVFFSGLASPFQGDDFDQIVDSVPVHSISHVGLLFEGGTFYAGQGLRPLEGGYYRPLMTTAFSIIYTLFGPHPLYYHLAQLLLYIGSAYFFYLFLRYSFKLPLALFLTLAFVVHPINSQVVFAIPSMQDSLFFFFGMLGLYLLVRFRSVRSLVPVAICILLSLLAKESAVLFVAIMLLYLFWWDRRRLLPFVGIVIVPVAIWLGLRIHAVGLLNNPYGGPIDRLSIMGRLFTAPSIVLFYITKFIFPLKLATTYYWVHPTFSFRYVLLPLIIDLTVAAAVVFTAFLIKKHGSKAMFYTYMFFAAWAAIGIGLLLQISPLDMTACELWFYFPMAGILGLLGVVLTLFPIRLHPNWLMVLAIVLLGVLGTRTAVRGHDYRTAYNLSLVDTVNSKDDYRADNIVARALVGQGRYAEALPYQEQAIKVNPTYSGYINLASILVNTDNYPGAENSYENSFRYSTPAVVHTTYEGIGVLTLLNNNTYAENRRFLEAALSKLPRDPLLWMYLALQDEKNGDNADAKVAITNAANLGQVPSAIYDNIMLDRPFSITIAGRVIQLPQK